MMRCPRCGWDNDPQVVACVRCALPVPGRQQIPGSTPPPHPGYGGPPAERPSAHPPHPYAAPPPPAGYLHHQQPEPPTFDRSGGAMWRPPPTRSAAPANPSTAIVTMLIAVLFTGGYGVWSLTLRREVFADFAAGVSVSTEVARSNDRIDLALVLVTSVTAVAAIVLWLLALRHRPGSAIGVIGLIAAGVGVAVVLVGLALAASVSGVDGPVGQGERGVTAAVLSGIGFLLLAAGLMCGAVGLRSAPTTPAATTASYDASQQSG